MSMEPVRVKSMVASGTVAALAEIASENRMDSAIRIAPKRLIDFFIQLFLS